MSDTTEELEDIDKEASVKDDTSHVKTMRGMFAGTKNINKFKNEIKGWNVKNVIDMEYMFYDCGDEILQDISSWEVSENCKINNIFAEKISNLKVKQEPVSLPQKKNHHVKLLVLDGRAFGQLLEEGAVYYSPRYFSV